MLRNVLYVFSFLFTYSILLSELNGVLIVQQQAIARVTSFLGFLEPNLEFLEVDARRKIMMFRKFHVTIYNLEVENVKGGQVQVMMLLQQLLLLLDCLFGNFYWSLWVGTTTIIDCCGSLFCLPWLVMDA
jgi:hypothetical protein